MQCPDCGAHFVKEDEFCGECGRQLSWETAGDSTDDKAWVAGPDSLDDLAGDLFEPPPPEPALVETKPKRSNLRTIALNERIKVMWSLMGYRLATIPTTKAVEDMPNF